MKEENEANIITETTAFINAVSGELVNYLTQNQSDDETRDTLIGFCEEFIEQLE